MNNLSEHLSKKNILLVGAITLLTLFALWMRLLPMFTMGNTDILSMVASDDPLYNLRQVEQLLVNFPNYAWFDPMTLYPSGSQIYWGSLFPTIVAVCCLILGATSRPDVISIGLLVPPVIGALIVPLMFFVGKTCGDWKTGLLASLFTAVVTGQYFYRSMYGYMDHHIAEVFFSALFCLMYMYVLMQVNSHKVNLKDVNTYKEILFLSALTGIVYVLGLYTMPTMILFAMIVGIFTAVLFVVNMMRGKNSEYLLIINTVVFAIAIIGTIIHGFTFNTIGLTTYSVGHIYSYMCIIMATAFLYAAAQFMIIRKKTWLDYLGGLVGIGFVCICILYVAFPQLYSLFVTSFIAFFGQQAITNTVQEARGWTTANAWATFGYGLLLMLGGAIVVSYKNIKENHPHLIFAFIWSVVMIYSTWQHIRYEYYLAINIALLSAILISFVIDRSMIDIQKVSNLITNEPNKEDELNKEKISKKQKKLLKKDITHNRPNYFVLVAIIIFAFFGCMFVYTSATSSYATSSSGAMMMNADWKESLVWMNNNTPDDGVDYYKIYNADTYKAPAESYGVMSWWDYGHMIIYIADRIPNANPFQEGVVGDAGAAPFFMSTNEQDANKILDKAGTRYVMTDTEMDIGKFWAMATWYNSSVSIDPYQMYILTPAQNNPSSYNPSLLNRADYYLTTVSKLHNFDGSRTVPTTAYYVVYSDAITSGMSMPVMVDAMLLNVPDAYVMAEKYNLNHVEGYHATVMNVDVSLPLTEIPALQHYRLVHESPTTTIKSDTVDIKYVKTFEYVKGAHIKGDGIIEVKVLTNTGRSFTYSQQSIKGEFIVPYSTTGTNTYDVKTVGKYKIVGTDKEFDVDEQSVMTGV